MGGGGGVGGYWIIYRMEHMNNFVLIDCFVLYKNVVYPGYSIIHIGLQLTPMYLKNNNM